jgi:hypothetical protein
MTATAIELRLIKPLEDSSNDGSGDRLLGTVQILGANHHLEFMRVVDDEEGGQRPENKDYQGTYDDVQVLYSGTYETFEVPGYEGKYIAFMTPYDD